MPPGFEARVGVQLRQYESVTVFERIEAGVPPCEGGWRQSSRHGMEMRRGLSEPSYPCANLADSVSLIFIIRKKSPRMLRGAQVSLAGRGLYHFQTMRIAPADAGQKFPHTRRLEWGLNPLQSLAMRRI